MNVIGKLQKFLEDFECGETARAMKNTVENSQWHREENTWVHTKMVLDFYVKNFAKYSTETDIKIAFLALLYHDVAKPMSEVPKTDGSGANSYPGHEPRSGVLFAEAYVQTPALQELLTIKEARAVRWIIEHHLPYGLVNKAKMQALRTSTARAMWEAGTGTHTFLDCLRSDSAGRISDDHAVKLAAVEEWIQTFVDVPGDWWSSPVAGSPTAYLLIGAPGAGKSTWTLLHAEHNPYRVLSMDALKIKFYQLETGLNASCESELYARAWHYCTVDHEKEFLAYAMPIADTVFRLGAESDEEVFVDMINATKKKRKAWITMARKYGMKVVGVEFWNTIETLQARQLTRGDKKVPAPAILENHYAQSSCWLGSEVDEVQIVIGS